MHPYGQPWSSQSWTKGWAQDLFSRPGDRLPGRKAGSLGEVSRTKCPAQVTCELWVLLGCLSQDLLPIGSPEIIFIFLTNLGRFCLCCFQRLFNDIFIHLDQFCIQAAQLPKKLPIIERIMLGTRPMTDWGHPEWDSILSVTTVLGLSQNQRGAQLGTNPASGRTYLSPGDGELLLTLLTVGSFVVFQPSVALGGKHVAGRLLTDQ